MTEEQFWDIIAASRSKWNSKRVSQSYDRQLADLERLLKTLSPEDIIAFDAQYARLHRAAYHWDLWAAAYMFNGGCSDDCFHYFRAWLISMGRQVYETALQNPDTLVEAFASLNGEEAEFENFSYVAWNVYEAKTGRDLPAHPHIGSSEPAGENWYPGEDGQEDEAEFARRFPHLYARFWHDEA